MYANVICTEVRERKHIHGKRRRVCTDTCETFLESANSNTDNLSLNISSGTNPSELFTGIRQPVSSSNLLMKNDDTHQLSQIAVFSPAICSTHSSSQICFFLLTEVLEGHTEAPGTTSRTTWEDVLPDEDIRALATTVCPTFEDCSKPDHPYGDDYDSAITNAIPAYHNWSTQQSIHLHILQDDPREWHPVGPPALEFYVHEDATTGAHSITSLRPTAPQPIPEPHIPPSPTKPHTPPQNNSPQRGQSRAAHKGTQPPSAPRPSNNPPSPSPHATSRITTNYHEGGTTPGARQQHGDYRQATSIGGRSTKE